MQGRLIENLYETHEKFSKKNKNILDLIDDDEATHIHLNKLKTVLLVGHRQALIRSMCQRINLNCYLDEPINSIAYNRRDFRKRFGVCLDSIKKVTSYDSPIHQYDLVIIDEVEQVLAHLLASTAKDSPGNLDAFSRIILNSQSVIAMDADLGWTSFLTLNAIRSRPSRLPTSNRTEIYINEFKETSRSYDIYDLKSELISQLMLDIASDKRLFVSTNSKKQVDSLRAAIQEKFPTKRLMAITSDNSNSKEVVDFIKNIKIDSKKYDVLISSPSLGTGIDITYSENEEFYDCVYGIYEGLINTHTEIDQQLSRVRHPKSIKIWISPRVFNFETNFDVIRSDLLTGNLIANTALDYATPLAEQVFTAGSDFLRTAALIISEQRHSKNNLRLNFIEYKKSQGWEPKIIKYSVDKKLGLDTLSFGKALEEQQYIQRLLDCNPIDQAEFIRIEQALDEDARVSQAEYLSFQRMQFELFYCREIDEAMIKNDARWALRRQYYAYRRFMVLEGREKWIQIHRTIPVAHLTKSLSIVSDAESVPMLLKGLFSSTPFYSNGKFDVEVEFANSDLLKFGQLCVRLKSVIETQLGR